MIQKKLDKVWGKDNILSLLLKDNFFVAGLALKILMSALFASNYMVDLFAPFIKSALQSNFWSIYNIYYLIKPNAFPYPPLMLYIMAFPRFVASAIWGVSGPVTAADIFCLKIPLLVADLSITIILIKWLQNLKRVVRWYWLSPIVTYICYVHGQLDIIPTAFFCFALYFLFKEKFKFFALFLVFACATKFHIIITIPFLIIYLYRHKKLKLKSLSRGIPAIILMLLLLNLPFLLQDGFIRMVYQNQEQGKIFTSYFELFQDFRFYFIPASYMLLLYTMAEFKFINKDILIIFVALGFGIFTFFLVPQPGWYLWNIPFFIYFLLRFDFQSRYLFILINIAYFLFFIIYAHSDFPQVAQLFFARAKYAPNLNKILSAYPINVYLIIQLAFTLLQAALLIFLISLYRLGVFQVKRYKIYNEPYLIGICGDSGSGKSTLTKSINELFGAYTIVIRGDDMHRWERGHEKWNDFTHLNPKANWLHRDLADLTELKAGKNIKRRNYDHNTGNFKELTSIASNKVVIYEGLHSFYLNEASKIYDLKIFMRPSEELRLQWKIERDVKQRGHQLESVLETINKRKTDANDYIISQEFEADIVFAVQKEMQSNHSDLHLTISASNDFFFEYLIDQLNMVHSLNVEHKIDRQKQEITVKGFILPIEVNHIASELQLDIKELIGWEPAWDANYLGVMQLFVVDAMFAQLKYAGPLSGN